MKLYEVIQESSNTVLYHVTKTVNVPKIKAKGITMGNPTNFKKAAGGRYGNFGEIFCMTSKIDAIRWAARWDWDLNKAMGSGKVSIVEFVDDPATWEEDDADPMSQASNEGKWLKKTGTFIKPAQIKGAEPVTSDMVKMVIQRANQRVSQPTNESETYQPPELAVGDTVLKGKFKNSPAQIKGFKKDQHNHPVLKTNKGDVQLFKPRLTKLMPKKD